MKESSILKHIFIQQTHNHLYYLLIIIFKLKPPMALTLINVQSPEEENKFIRRGEEGMCPRNWQWGLKSMKF